jgi:UDP-GlcNAc:undecaprenyl-phosphate/decaprenyl-phosphate GlcNAc-1-phosphate transferase
LPSTLYAICAIAGVLSAALCFLIVRQRPSKLGSDAPDLFRKGQIQPISRLGGIPIFLSLFAVLSVLRLTGNIHGSHFNALMTTNGLMFLVGFLDDLSPKGARFKLGGQLVVALVAYSMGLRIETFHIPFTDEPVMIGQLSLILTIGWLIFVPNIVNLIDGLDGLAGGMGIFLCLVLGILGVVSENPMAAAMSVTMLGALSGFLIFNFPPAKIYLGDGGAYLIGYFVGSVSLAGFHKGSVAAALLVVVVALGLPLMDTVFAILRRGITGLPLFRADAEHIHHRIALRGFSKNRTLLMMYGTTVLFGLAGLSLFWNRGQTLPIVGALVVSVTFASARYLGYVRNWRTFLKDIAMAWSRRGDIRYALMHNELLEVEIDRSRTAEEFWLAFMESLYRVGLEHVSHSTNAAPEHTDRIITLKMADQSSWHLRYRDDSRAPQDWVLIAKCLQGAYSSGVTSWGPCRTTPQDESTKDGR